MSRKVGMRSPIIWFERDGLGIMSRSGGELPTRLRNLPAE
jgi:hypothetical protein